jgi:cell division protease FtsH
MIVKYGMDKELGTVTYLENNKNEYSMFRGYSEKTAEIIDEKIKKYMADCYEKSKKLIVQNKQLIEKLSVVLLDKEYLTKDEFESMITNFTKPKKLKA